jgi:hypothetical protein
MLADYLLPSGVLFLLAEGIVFAILNELLMSSKQTKKLQSLSRLSRKLFRSKNSATIIAALWGSALSAGMAAYTLPLPKGFFDLSYALFVVAVIWSVGTFLTSSFFSNLRVRTRGGTSYKLCLVIVPTTIVAVGLYWAWKVSRMELAQELALMNGLLVPANDPEPPTKCNTAGEEGSELRLYAGDMRLVLVEGDKLPLIRRREQGKGDPVLLGLERGGDGSVVVHANIIGSDDKVIAQIDRNHFLINRNKILDSLSPPRKDRSTIVITDEDQNSLEIRLVNNNSVFFRGRLYVRPDAFVQVDEKGLYIEDGGPYSTIHNLCVLFHYYNDTNSFLSVP